MNNLDKYIRVIPDFPEPGVLFRDITTVFQDAEGMQLAIDQMQDQVKDLDFDVIVGAESRGFIYGAAMAYNLHKPLVLVRKKGKLPWKTESVDYDLEYGKATLEIHVDAIKPGQRCLLVDDLLATGGTVKAGAQLIEKLGCGAAMAELCRVKSGRFTLADAVTIDGVRPLLEAGTLEEKLFGED